jgi:hypothetical protein
MLKISYQDGDTQAYLACDRCGQKISYGDVIAYRVDAMSKPVNGQALALHAACCRYATGEGSWQIEPIKGLVVDIAAGLRDFPPEMQRKEKRQRLIIKQAAAAGKKGVSVRDIQRANPLYTAAELHEHMDNLVAVGILTVEDIRPAGAGRPHRRYYAHPLALEAATLARV